VAVSHDRCTDNDCKVVNHVRHLAPAELILNHIIGHARQIETGTLGFPNESDNLSDTLNTAWCPKTSYTAERGGGCCVGWNLTHEGTLTYGTQTFGAGAG